MWNPKHKTESAVWKMFPLRVRMVRKFWFFTWQNWFGWGWVVWSVIHGWYFYVINCMLILKILVHRVYYQALLVWSRWNWHAYGGFFMCYDGLLLLQRFSGTLYYIRHCWPLGSGLNLCLPLYVIQIYQKYRRLRAVLRPKPIWVRPFFQVVL